MNFGFPQKCVVVQEVYPNGLIADDGRLQPGDQIIEINGIDIACARHSQVYFKCMEIGTKKYLSFFKIKTNLKIN